MLRHRMLHEHDVLELCFVNNRWYTRTDRIMVLFTRITLKVSVLSSFRCVILHSGFVWSGSEMWTCGENLWQYYALLQQTRCSERQGPFCFSLAERRRQLYSHLLQVENIETEKCEAGAQTTTNDIELGRL